MTQQPPPPQPALSAEDKLRLAVEATEQLARRSEAAGLIEDAEEERRVGLQIRSLVERPRVRR